MTDCTYYITKEEEKDIRSRGNEGLVEYFSCLNQENEHWEFLPPSSEDIQNIVEETSVIDERIRAGIQLYLSAKSKIDTYV